MCVFRLWLLNVSTVVVNQEQIINILCAQANSASYSWIEMEMYNCLPSVAAEWRPQVAEWYVCMLHCESCCLLTSSYHVWDCKLLLVKSCNSCKQYLNVITRVSSAWKWSLLLPSSYKGNWVFVNCSFMLISQIVVRMLLSHVCTKLLF